MTFKNRMSAMPFAHLLGLAVSAKAEEEDEDRKQKEDESDEDYAKRMEDKDKEEEAKRAEEEKKKEDARKAEEEKKKEEEAKRAKKAKRADEDGDDDADMEDEEDDGEEGKRAGRASDARQRERFRCARIVAAGIASGRVNQACAFAFDTKLSSNQAIVALNAAGLDTVATRGSGLRERMSAVQLPNPGTNVAATAPSSDPAKANADRIIAAGERARGK